MKLCLVVWVHKSLYLLRSTQNTMTVLLDYQPNHLTNDQTLPFGVVHCTKDEWALGALQLIVVSCPGFNVTLFSSSNLFIISE
ncbi:unnamed protein product [Auanema sp. JU1783]|nr:unnamed protein product [Auanema sp. JU1783]